MLPSERREISVFLIGYNPESGILSYRVSSDFESVFETRVVSEKKGIVTLENGSQVPKSYLQEII